MRVLQFLWIVLAIMLVALPVKVDAVFKDISGHWSKYVVKDKAASF